MEKKIYKLNDGWMDGQTDRQKEGMNHLIIILIGNVNEE